MRRTVLIVVAVFVLALVGSHVLVLRALPTVVMNRGLGIIADLGVEANQWYAAPRITSETSSVVRSSPDLAYAACLLDLSAGPVHIMVPAGEGYGSLSVFDGDTTNAFVGPIDEGQSVRLVVHRAGQPVDLPPNAIAVELRSAKGVALVRRLASTQALHARAQALVPDSRCEAV